MCVFDGLRFPHDAAEQVAFELHADSIAADFGVMQGLLELTGGVIDEALALLRGCVVSGVALQQAAARVVAKAAHESGVDTLDQLSGRVEAVGLLASVDVELRDDAVHHVVRKRGARTVFVREGGESSGRVVLVALSEPTLMARDHATRGVTLDAGAFAIGTGNAHEITGGAVRISGGLAQCVDACNDSADRVEFVAEAAAFLALLLNQLAPAVVAITGHAGRAVGDARLLLSRSPCQAHFSALGVFDGVGLFASFIGVVKACDVAQGIGSRAGAAQRVVFKVLARTGRAAHRHDLAMCVVFPLGFLAVRIGDRTQVAGDGVQLVTRLAPQCVHAAGESPVAVILARGDRAIRVLQLNDPFQSLLALETVDPRALQAVRYGGGIGAVVKAVGERAGPVLLDDLALPVVHVGDGRSARKGVRHHPARQLRVILEAALQQSAATVDRRELASGAVFVAHQGQRWRRLGGMRVVRQVDGDQAHTRVFAPAVRARRGGGAQRLRFKPKLAAAGVLYEPAVLRWVSPNSLCVSEAIVETQQMQAHSVDVGALFARPENPPGTQWIVGGEEHRGIAAVFGVQALPRNAQSCGQVVRGLVESIGATAHDPEAFAAAVRGLSRLQGLEANAAALAVIELQEAIRLHQRGLNRQPPTGAEQAHGCGRIGLVARVFPAHDEGQGIGQGEVGLGRHHLGSQHRVDRIAFCHTARTDGAGHPACRPDIHRERALRDRPPVKRHV